MAVHHIIRSINYVYMSVKYNSNSNYGCDCKKINKILK